MISTDKSNISTFKEYFCKQKAFLMKSVSIKKNFKSNKGSGLDQLIEELSKENEIFGTIKMPGNRFRFSSFSSNKNNDALMPNIKNINESNEIHSRIVVLGASAVGKTAILHQFLYGQFPEEHKATVDQLYRNECKIMKRLDKKLTLDILDTSGSYEFPAMKRLAIEKADAFLLVYSVDNADSFEEVCRLREQILQIKLAKHNEENKIEPQSIPHQSINYTIKKEAIPQQTKNDKNTDDILKKIKAFSRLIENQTSNRFNEPTENMRRKNSLNLNHRYKLPQNLVNASNRRKSLSSFTSTNSPKMNSNLFNINEDIIFNAHKPTADIICVKTNFKPKNLPSFVFEQMRRESIAKIKKENFKKSKSIFGSDSDDSDSVSSEKSSSSSSYCSMSSLNDKSLEENKDENINSFKHLNCTKYNYNKRESLKNNFFDQLSKIKPPIIVVAGNKCDLESKRAVQKEVAETIVQIDWDNGFIECSAKNNINITSIFKELIKQSKLPFSVGMALDSQKCRRRSLPAYTTNGLPTKERLRPKRNSCALS